MYKIQINLLILKYFLEIKNILVIYEKWKFFILITKKDLLDFFFYKSD